MAEFLAHSNPVVVSMSPCEGPALWPLLSCYSIRPLHHNGNQPAEDSPLTRWNQDEKDSPALIAKGKAVPQTYKRFVTIASGSMPSLNSRNKQSRLQSLQDLMPCFMEGVQKAAVPLMWPANERTMEPSFHPGNANLAARPAPQPEKQAPPESE